MPPRFPIMMVLVVITVTGSVKAGSVGDDFLKCGDLQHFKTAPYLKVAEELQALTEAERVKVLNGFSSIPEHDLQTIILCRMLFMAKSRGTFRRPGLGLPCFIDSGAEDPGNLMPETFRHWPLEPITLVDDIPFAVVSGYTLAGVAEKAAAYLSYCLKETEWSPARYHSHSGEQLGKALQKLQRQIPQRSLTPWLGKFLRRQIETP